MLVESGDVQLQHVSAEFFFIFRHQVQQTRQHSRASAAGEIELQHFEQAFAERWVVRGYCSCFRCPAGSNDGAQIENQKDPDADPVHRIGHSGMFPCFLRGFVSRLFSRERKAVISLARVWAGSITASM